MRIIHHFIMRIIHHFIMRIIHHFIMRIIHHFIMRIIHLLLGAFASLPTAPLKQLRTQQLHNNWKDFYEVR